MTRPYAPLLSLLLLVPPGAAALGLPAPLPGLPVDVAGGLEELSWARLGMMGLVANTLETEAGLAIVDPAIVRRLAVGDAGSPVRRRTWREATGAGYSLTLRLSRAGPLLQLDATLDGAEGTQQRSLFGEEAGRLALDMSAVVRGWLDPRPRGEAPPAGGRAAAVRPLRLRPVVQPERRVPGVRPAARIRDD